MGSLSRVRVLLATDQASEQDFLTMWLASEGADVRVCTWPALADEAARFPAMVLVADLCSGETRSLPVLEALRALPRAQPLPVIALVPGKTPLSDAAANAKCHKYINMPVHPADLVAAIASLANDVEVAPIEPSREALFQSIIDGHASRRDVRAVLRFVNSAGPFRYTSIMRFEDDDHLTSVWTYDRENPETDSFPLDIPSSASYCGRVRDARAPFLMPDSDNDASVADHPARHAVRAYCGVPLEREDGSFFGTLCQFDASPRFFQELMVTRLGDAAAALSKYLPELSRNRGK